MTTRNVRGFGDVVVSPHDLATSAGLEVMAAGGSAVDAAIAVNAVQGVVAPETCGVGGDLFAMVWEPDAKTPATLNASGWAGSGADAEELPSGSTIPPDHPLSVTIPGAVAGWGALHDRFGRVSMGTILGPAIHLAEQGFPVSFEMSQALSRRRDQLMSQTSGVDLYPDGEPPPVGASVRRPLLATTLSDIVTDGTHGFYTGAAAADMSAAVGGRITRADLAEYHPDWIEPAHLEVFGHTAWTIPPNSQGYLTLAALGVFERLGDADIDDPVWLHRLIESYRSVAWERDDVVADSRFAPSSWEELLDPERLAARAESIGYRAGVWPRPGSVPGGTAYMCTVGADGQAVSLIQSNFMGIGSGIGAGTSGFFLHNRGAGFNLIGGHPNRLAPGHRPLHTLSPTMWTKDDRLGAVLGTRGGHQQPQLLIQMAAAMFGAGMDPAAAQNRARWTMDEFGKGTGSALLLEDAGDTSADDLRTLGHEVEVVPAFQGGWGPVSTVVVRDDGLRTAAADPRVDTASAAVR